VASGQSERAARVGGESMAGGGGQRGWGAVSLNREGGEGVLVPCAAREAAAREAKRRAERGRAALATAHAARVTAARVRRARQGTGGARVGVGG
jgi:hypothetical protein